MIQITENILNEIVQCLVRTVDPEEVILFGSRACGKDYSDSDLDLVVIQREPFGPNHSRRKELLNIRRALSSFRIPKDILLFSVDEAMNYRQSRHHILAHATREGRRLYARS